MISKIADVIIILEYSVYCPTCVASFGQNVLNYFSAFIT